MEGNLVFPEYPVPKIVQYTLQRLSITTSQDAC